MSNQRSRTGPPEPAQSQHPSGRPSQAAPGAPPDGFDYESDALLDSLFDDDPKRPPPAVTSRSTRPPPGVEEEAESLSDEEFEELPAGTPSESAVELESQRPPPAGEDDIDALLAQSAPDSEPLHGDWDPPTSPALSPLPSARVAPAEPGARLMPSRSPSITRTAPFATRLDHRPVSAPSEPPAQATAASLEARTLPPEPVFDEDTISRKVSLSDSDLDAPTRVEARPNALSAAPNRESVVELQADSFASIPGFGHGDSFASIQDYELEEADSRVSGATFPATELRQTARPAPGEWSNERPAAAHLAEQGTDQLWRKRAELMTQEAQARKDPQAKARAWLVASELWAMAGDFERSRETARSAAQAARGMALALRQTRGLAAAEGDWKSVLQALDVEARTGQSSKARAHSAYFAAEVQRVALGDEAGGLRKLDGALRADPNDPRAHVSKLLNQLATTQSPPRGRLPAEPVFSALNAATDEIVKLRGGPSGAELGENPKVLFQAARRALALGDRTAAATAIAALTALKGLERPCLWLAAALFAPGPELRSRALELLRKLLNGPDSASARRALAARAIEQGDQSALSEALGGGAQTGAAESSFSAGDRIALAALAGSGAAQSPALEPWLHDIAMDEQQRPLAAAALAAAHAPGSQLEILAGSERSRSELGLGRALSHAALHGAGEAVTRASLEAFTGTHRNDALGRVLELELSLKRLDAESVASALAAWPKDESDDRDADRDRHWAAALVYELAGNSAAADREYARSLAADPGAEASVRALIARAPAERSRDMLTGLAELCTDNTQAALWLVEAALRLGSDHDAYADLLGRAADAQPQLPFALRLSEQLARSRGDAEGVLRCLRQRRETSSDAVERALDLVREALLVADDDMTRAATLLEEALKARPADVALHELFERLSTDVSSERGRWREQVAEHVEGALKLRMLLEAALEYERAGDSESAARAALLAAEAKDSEFARVIAERAASSGAGASRLSERLFAQARAEQDPRAQREFYERLSTLDRVRGDTSSALLWHSAILERTPDHLPALRRLEHAYIASGRDEDLEQIAVTLAALLDANEGNAHAVLAARLRTRAGSWTAARDMADLAAKLSPAPLWALRALTAHARASADDTTTLDVNRRLAEHAKGTLDGATLGLRAAEAAFRLGKWADADKLLTRVIELTPGHWVALVTQAHVLLEAGDFSGAASAFEAVARSSSVAAHRLDAWYRAAVIWLDRLNDLDRAQTALENACQTEPVPDDVIARLQAVYVAKNDRPRLAALLEKRLQNTTDPEQRIAIEVTRGRALAEIGDNDAAKQALRAALDANPDHAGALAAFADLCATQKDYASAEQAWIRLVRHAPSADEQTEIYRKLGSLYERELPNPERAELAYKEVLKRKPADTEATERLVHVYGRMGDTARSLELQNELVQRAETPEQKRDATLGLAGVYEHIVGDRRKAEATLDKARKTWSQDSSVLRALAEFHQRAGEQAAFGVLLDRSAADARRALQTGRFDPAFFDILATVAELRGDKGSAMIARATLAALTGRDVSVNGAGSKASAPDLDELLSPELMSPPLRALLRRCGSALDAAYPLDLRALRAAPAPASTTLLSSTQRLASSFGLSQCELYVSPVLGSNCLPASTEPARLIVGNALLESADEGARYFLIVRALKILQGRAGALSRTAPIELWPVLAGFLSLFAPEWQPQGVDARRLLDAQQRLREALPATQDDELRSMALEVIGSIGNRASQLATVVYQWGNRSGLLAVGDPAAALRGVASAAGQLTALPAEGSERVKWIVRNPEARDVCVFSVSEQYAALRARLGLDH
ncbi:MAG TPA: tetratricopeptide repeat protein [Polyangiaceae bacterium]|nr:tetratricopeptide repeat protein [Polyangiaceae bacterium]